ncbi:MAG: Rap1a/Tai family immunity protein [Gammaproteobacteria bacterium]|nr:Rap1a/Tai family immunity protein [Gammaproteobacteria bacterium]
MKRLLWVVILLWPVAGFPMDGNQLLKACKMLLKSESAPLTAEESMQAMVCSGYVGGIWELVHYFRVAEKPAGNLFCPTGRVEPRKAVQITVTYLEQHPDLLRYLASQQVVRAFQEAFPCDNE